jgi:hypothetical protein
VGGLGVCYWLVYSGSFLAFASLLAKAPNRLPLHAYHLASTRLRLSNNCSRRHVATTSVGSASGSTRPFSPTARLLGYRSGCCAHAIRASSPSTPISSAPVRLVLRMHMVDTSSLFRLTSARRRHPSRCVYPVVRCARGIGRQPFVPAVVGCEPGRQLRPLRCHSVGAGCAREPVMPDHILCVHTCALYDGGQRQTSAY